jgi:hypothetical protein
MHAKPRPDRHSVKLTGRELGPKFRFFGMGFVVPAFVVTRSRPKASRAAENRHARFTGAVEFWVLEI